MNSNRSQNLKVAFLGPLGTYSQAAVIAHFGEEIALHNCNSIDDVFVAVENSVADYGVVPVENSTEGAINNTQDCLVDSELRIVGEEVISIEHKLLCRGGDMPSAITRIASHKQSLAQCRHWLKKNYPDAELIECASNAEAAQLALKDSSIAAVAGALAADLYNLKSLADSIQDQQHNSTRFLILSDAMAEASANDKTSVIIYTENKPGSLFRVLEPFERLNISLSKIETRPSKKEAWEYVFFIDFEGHHSDEKIIELFTRLRSCTAEIKLLGSYPAAASQETDVSQAN